MTGQATIHVAKGWFPGPEIYCKDDFFEMSSDEWDEELVMVVAEAGFIDCMIMRHVIIQEMRVSKIR